MNGRRKAMTSPRARRWLHWALLLLYWAEFLGIFLFLIWKCQYGFGDADEAFTLATPLRFVRGDRMLLDEWHMSQFGSFTMIPEMWIYLQIAKNTEGMILAFRYIYTVIWSAGCLFLYFRVRKFNEYGARCASLFLQCYAPLGIMALSYNTLGILYLTNAVVFLLCARRCQKAQFFLSGLFFAGAVLCCPYLAGIYLLYSGALGIARLRKKNPVLPGSGASLSVCWRYFTLGAALLAVVFLTALLARGSDERLLDALPYALADEEHIDFSFIHKSADYITRLSGSNAYFFPMLAVVLLMIPLTLRWRNLSWLWFCAVCAACGLFLRRFMQERAYVYMTNSLMLPATFIGLFVMAVTRQRETRWVGWFWLIPGVLYTFCLNYTSNQLFYAICSASSFSSAAGYVMMGMYAKELRETARAGDASLPANRRFPQAAGLSVLCAYAAALAFFGLQMYYEIPVRTQTVYWELGLMESREQRVIDRGPENGVIASAEKAEKYEQLYADVSRIDHQRVLFLSEQIWMVLVNENENASYSSWIWRINDYAVNRLKQYYSVRPEKRPEIIFLEQENEAMLQYFDPSRDEIRRLESGNYLISPNSWFE